MGANVDEDLIEATIRRVAEAKAAADAPESLDAGERGSRPADKATVAAQKDPLAPEAEDREPFASTSVPQASLDESAIEATIRRVADAKAGFHAEAPSIPARPAEERSGTPDELAIEETIRRVAEAKAAQATDEQAAASGGDATPVGADSEIVADTDLDAAASDASAGVRAGPTAVDETAIEATIRRVAEAKAAREVASSSGRRDGAHGTPRNTEATGGDPEIASNAENEPSSAGETVTATTQATTVEESAIQATVRRVAQARASRDDRADDAEHIEVSAARAIDTAAPADDDWRTTTDRLERDVIAISRALAGLSDRLDQVLPALARVSPTAGAEERMSGSSHDAEEWDDGPTISRLPTSMPPRPTIIHGAPPSARPAATQGKHDSAIDDTEDSTPLRAPPPTPAADPKRGFDLLPRTYRITVEDKRRSVDLVPLHRSLRGMEGVRDMSLLSYNNGIAIVSLESVSDIDPKALEQAVSRAMSRAARVEVHNEHTLVVKLAEE